MQVAWPVASQESRQLPVGFLLCFVVVFFSPFCCLGLFVGFLVSWFVGPPSLRFARLFRFYLTFLAFAPLIGRKYQKWQCMTTMFIMIIMLPHDHPHDPECHDQECLGPMSMAMLRIRTLMSSMPFVPLSVPPSSVRSNVCLSKPSTGTAPKRVIDRSIDIAKKNKETRKSQAKRQIVSRLNLGN